jgi:hypothetical protein
MAFAVTAVECYGKEIDEPLTKKFEQTMVLSYTAANTDVDCDLGDYTGTFWTAAGGSAAGATALKSIKAIQIRAQQFAKLGGEALLDRVQGTSAASGVYTAAMDGTNTHIPNLTFHSTTAPTSAKLILTWVLKDNEPPVKVSA